MKFSVKDCFSKWKQNLSKRRIYSHILKKSLVANFIFCAVMVEYFGKLLQKKLVFQKKNRFFI